MSDLLVVGKVLGQRKSDSRPYLKLTVLVPADSGGYEAVTQWAPPEIASEVSAVPGVYSATTTNKVRNGQMVSEIQGLSLVTSGFPR
jgi:hypothetical protein